MGIPFELHRLVDTIQMSTHMLLKRKSAKKTHTHTNYPSLIFFFLSVPLVRVGQYFISFLSMNIFEKPKHTVQ